MFYLFRVCLLLFSALTTFKRVLFTPYPICKELAVLMLDRVFYKTLSIPSLVKNLSTINVEVQFGSVCLCQNHNLSCLSLPQWCRVPCGRCLRLLPLGHVRPQPHRQRQTHYNLESQLLYLLQFLFLQEIQC